MQHIKAFIGGLVVPGFLLPAILTLFNLLGVGFIISNISLHFIPWLWGIWNVLYFAICKDCLPGDVDTRMWLTGALLGFIVALIAIFCLNLPQMMGYSGGMEYLPLIIAPIVYGVFWRYLVKPVNKMLGLKN